MNILAFLLPALLAAGPPTPLPRPQEAQGVPGLLREIEKEVRDLGGYPGEDFIRGEFFLGAGDDDTYKTHHVGILIREEIEGPRLTIQVVRLEPSEREARVKYGREPRLVVCRILGARVDIVRSDYAPADLEALLKEVVRAVVDKKNLLKR